MSEDKESNDRAADAQERVQKLEMVAWAAARYLACLAEFGDVDAGYCSERADILSDALDKLGVVYIPITYVGPDFDAT